MNYDQMDITELMSEFNDLLYWLYFSGCDIIDFKSEDGRAYIFLKDITGIGFTCDFDFVT